MFFSFLSLSQRFVLCQFLEKIVSKVSKESDEIYEIHGWREIGIETEKRAMENNAIIITPSYAACSMLAFYTPSKMQTHMFGKGAIHGLNYKYWDGDFSKYTGRNAIWVYKEPPKKDDLELMRESFESINEHEKYDVSVRGVEKRTFYFVECLNLKGYKIK